MSRTRIRRRQVTDAPPAVSEKQVRRQIGHAAGTDYFQYRDPLYHVTEDFQTTFDAVGRRHAELLAGKGGEPEGEQGRAEGITRSDLPDKTASESFYERRSDQEQDMLRRFSETAFQRGTLSGAVLRGTGQMMLFSCLKKTVGQNQPDKWQQRKLFETASPHYSAPGPAPSKVVFNRGFTDSAIGIVVDTLRDARQTVEDMQALAAGRSESETGTAGAARTLQKMYPFLDDRQERGLLEQYQAQLDGLEEGDPKRSILHNALRRTRALIEKKAQMKTEFINKLRFLSDRATEALEVFQEPGFPQMMLETLRQELDTDAADSGGDEDGAAGPADSPADGAGAGAEAQ